MALTELFVSRDLLTDTLSSVSSRFQSWNRSRRKRSAKALKAGNFEAIQNKLFHFPAIFHGSEVRLPPFDEIPQKRNDHSSQEDNKRPIEVLCRGIWADREQDEDESALRY